MLNRLDEEAHQNLDKRLASLVWKLNAKHKQYGAITLAVREILESAVGKLIYPQWRDTWALYERVSSAWFEDINRGDVSRTLYAVFCELIRFSESAKTNYQKDQITESLRAAIYAYHSAHSFRLPKHKNKNDLTKPVWDSDRRVLSLEDLVLREFKQNPAPNQEKLLDAFELHAWDEVIPNPFAKGNLKDPLKLNSTIYHLNKSLLLNAIRFRSNGGDGAMWCYAKKK